MALVKKFEIHYHLLDNSHSMNAFIKNKCEAEFLAVAVEVAEILGIQIVWESQPLEEGGIREIWAAIGTNNSQIALIISVLALIWSMVPHSDQELFIASLEGCSFSSSFFNFSISSFFSSMERRVSSF